MTTETANETGNNQQQQQQQQQMKQDYITSNSLTSSNSSTNSSLNTSNRSDDQLQAQQLSPLNDPDIKFPLENSWSFWFYKGEKSKTWKENVKFITSVDHVEDFWGVYNHLQLVSKISIGCDYMFFKKDVPPMWEDAQNLDGGRWVLNLDKKYHNNSLDIYWLNTLLALIGDQFLDESPYVNGVWVNVRGKADKIALWTKSAKNAEVQLKIGHRLKEILALKDKDLVLTYEEHQTSNSSSEPSYLYKC
jgi:translation initiation factor 4E